MSLFFELAGNVLRVPVTEEQTKLVRENPWGWAPKHVQHLSFDKRSFTKKSAKSWAKREGYAAAEPTSHDKHWDIKQLPVENFPKLRPVQLAPGVTAWLGRYRKAKKNPVPGQWGDEPYPNQTLLPGDLTKIGEVEEITYAASKEGKDASWRHQFDNPPDLVANEKGQLALVGPYKLTDRGIEG